MTSTTGTRLVRGLLAVALALGVLGMHALVGPTSADAGTSMVMPSHDGTPAPADDGHAPAGGHSMLMTCLAVLGALVAVAVVLVSLARWEDVRAAAAGRTSWIARRAGRAPPWTVPSLHQLSLLRV